MRGKSSKKASKKWPNAERERKSSISSTSSQTSVLRIYSGPALLEHSGSDYKAIANSDCLTAREIIALALQRYLLDDEHPDDFVLCDTVGHLESYSRRSGARVDSSESIDEADLAYQFVTHYSRLVHPAEHPQLLALSWQPEEKCERRFILHPRTAVPPFRPMASPLMSSPPDSRLSSRSSSFDTLLDEEDTAHLTITQRHSASSSQAMFTSVHTDNVNVPFLITLTCAKPEKSLLAYLLVDKVTTIGRLSTNSKITASNLSIGLHGNDLLPLHCCIRCTELITSSQSKRLVYSLEPAKDAAVAVNGEVVTDMVTLRSGDLLQLGRKHAFVYRDPAKAVNTAQGWPWLPQPNFPTLEEEGDDAAFTSSREELAHGSSQSLHSGRQELAHGSSQSLLSGKREEFVHGSSQSLHSGRRNSDATASETEPSVSGSPKKVRSPSDPTKERTSSEGDASVSTPTTTRHEIEGPRTPSSQVVKSVSGTENARKLRFSYSLGSLEERADSASPYKVIYLTSDQHEDAFLHWVVGTVDITSLPMPLVPAACICLALHGMHVNTPGDDMMQISQFVTKISEEIQEAVWVRIGTQKSLWLCIPSMLRPCLQQFSLAVALYPL